jgi:hypothetical protein
MAVLYQVDFRTLPNQTIGAAGSFTVDGKTVWAKGTLTPSGTVLQTAIVNGGGLRMDVVSGSGVTPIGSGADLLHRHLYWPLSQFEGWDAGKAYMLRARFTYNTATTQNTPFFGIANSTSDAANLLAAQRAGDLFLAPTGSAGSVSTLSVKLGGAAATTATGRAGAIVNNECVVGVYHFTPRFAYLGSEHLAAGMPTDPSTWLAVTSVAVLDYDGLRTNPGIFLGHSSGDNDFYLQQMRLESIGALADTTLPTATLVSPSSLTRLTRVQPVVFSVQDETDLKRVHVWIRFASGETEVVYAEGQFERGYAGYSTQSGTNPKVLTIRRDFGWPSPMTGEFHFDPVDAGGNSSV